MHERATVRDDDRGLLLPAEGRTHYTLTRLPPPDDLASAVHQQWVVAWDLAEPYVAGALPFAAVNLTVETHRGVVVTGVTQGRYDYEVRGRGRVVGVRFRPGGVRPLLGDEPVASLTGREVPGHEVVGREAAHDLLALCDAPEDEALAGTAEVLRRWLPVDDERARLAQHLVEVVAVQPDVVRVEQLADAAALSVRSLQRLFHEQVGVPPKWVLMRERLHDAVLGLAAGDEPDMGSLSARLGYADQAHFTRDVRVVVGMPPAAYARRCAEAAAPPA